ncbi:MAG: hypothetical protein IPL87_02770 [Candidatus Moraniibacteriota bacterium]|nr:MAG: hypothetical protein IPL87_02770 [Candidatus Moranbacteria bacterium]
MNVVHYFAKNVWVVFGIVLIWRGLWYLLDELDRVLFGGAHFVTAVIGIIVGLFVLYLPDRDLKELEKL